MSRALRDERRVPKHSESPRLALRAVIIPLVLLLSLPSLAAEVTKSLGPGVVLTQIIERDCPEPLVINVLKIDTKNPNVKIEAALAGDTVLDGDPTNGRETISRLTERLGALAAVNADFFPYTGDPLGIAITNGEMVSEPFPGRAALGISRGGWFLFDTLGFSGQVTAADSAVYKLAGVNRLRGPNELICYTPAYGSAIPGRNDCTDATLTGLTSPPGPNKQIGAIVQSVAPGPSGLAPTGGCILSGNGLAAKFISDNLHPGDKVTIKLDVISQLGKNWTPVVQAVAGGPWLVRYGQVYVDGDAEKFSRSLVFAKHPRTAVGMTAAKELLLVTVDGRQWISGGMTLSELAELMKSLGAVSAINLDGGGSTSMSVRGMVINSPCEGIERPVANALVVRVVDPNEELPDIGFASSQLAAQAGVGQQLALADAVGKTLEASSCSNVVWGTKGGIGFVNQSGFFVPLRTGSGSVMASLGAKRAEMKVTVTTGAPATVTAVIKDDPAGIAGRSSVEVKVADIGGNPVAGRQVEVTATGGTADATQMTTDAKGIAVFGVSWDMTGDAAARSVTVVVTGVPPVTVRPPTG